MKSEIFKLQIVLALLAIFILFTTCAPKTKTEDTLRKISAEEVINRIKDNQVNLFYLRYRDFDGNELSDSTRKKFNKGELFRDFYEDGNGKVVEVRLKPALEKDIFDEIQIRELLAKPFSNIDLVDLECSHLENIITEAHDSDQSARNGGSENIWQVDKQNQQMVLSLLTKCGWPETKELIKGVWFVIQHADSGFMAYFYPKFKQLEKDGLLDSKDLAMMEDRLLMNNGFPQIYGSQIVGKNVYKLKDPKNVNKRREAVGMTTIEENTLRFGFEFKLEDYLKE